MDNDGHEKYANPFKSSLEVIARKILTDFRMKAGIINDNN
jgi:hypothetical protein